MRNSYRLAGRTATDDRASISAGSVRINPVELNRVAVPPQAMGIVRPSGRDAKAIVTCADRHSRPATTEASMSDNQREPSCAAVRDEVRR